MNIKSEIKEFQDSSRDAGWRINTINFRKDGETEKLYETSPPIIRTISNFSLLIVVIFLLWKYSGGPEWCNTLIIVSFISVIVCTILSNIMTCYNFVAVKAICIDKEIKDYKSYGHKTGSHTHFTFRTLCEFEFEGNTYKVTPENQKMFTLNSENQVQKYLKKYINGKGECILMVNPNNPLQAIIGKKNIAN